MTDMRWSTKKWLPWFAVAVVLAGAWVVLGPGGGPAAEASDGAGDGSWRLDSLWDDGKAEFAAYEVDWSRYGNVYWGRALLILVKEPWAPDLDVKADRPRPDGFDVLKLNHLRDVATGIYTYHQMASLFWRRDTGTLVKSAATSSEACGISTALMRDGELATHSYFDGQGDETHPYPKGVLQDDGLAASLRDYVQGPLPESLEVFPSLLQGRFPALEAESRRLSRRQEEAFEVPAGTFPAVVLRLEGEGSWAEYAFQEELPHTLLQLRRSDGTEYRLAKVERLPYWDLNGPGGEEWLPERLRH